MEDGEGSTPCFSFLICKVEMTGHKTSLHRRGPNHQQGLSCNITPLASLEEPLLSKEKRSDEGDVPFSLPWAMPEDGDFTEKEPKFLLPLKASESRIKFHEEWVLVWYQGTGCKD